MKYFETIKCIDEEPYNLEYHQKRVMRTVGLNFNFYEYINPCISEILRCKVIYDENEIINVSYYKYEKRDVKSFKIVYDNSIDYSFKYLDRGNIDFLFEKRDECDEVMIFKNNLLTDTSIANIAVLVDGIWYTPKKPLLNGTTRQRYLDEKKIIEKDIDLKFLQSAEKIALMNAMIDFDEIKNYSFKL